MIFHPVRVDPYDKATGMLVPFVTQRMLQMAKEFPAEYSGEKVVQQYLTRLYSGDPTVLILAVVGEKGIPVGHVVASLQGDGDLRDPTTNRWVFVAQTKMDENVGDARQDVMAMLDVWGRSNDATEMLMATGKNEKPWEKRYGFRTIRRVCARQLGTKPTEE